MESLVLLPIATVSMPGGLIQAGYTVAISSPTVLSQKLNTEASNLVAVNEATDQKLTIAQTAEQTADLAKAQAINAYFTAHDMPLAGTGMTMVTQAKKNSLDWRLLPAIAVRESTGGKYGCARVNNNPFGWGSCKIGFKSNEEAIQTIAQNLGGNNPDTASYYDNKTTKQILHAYNPPSIIPHYAEQVMSIMDDIGEADTATNTASASLAANG